MTDPTHLKSLLTGLADETRAQLDALPTEHLRSRIRRRRRARHAAYSGTFVAVTAVVGVASTFVLDRGDSTDPPTVASPNTEPRQGVPLPGACGQSLTTRDPQPPSPLEMTVDLAPSVPQATDDSSARLGTITVTNTSDDVVEGVHWSYPWVTVTKDAVTVTESGVQRAVGIPLTLAPGESITFDVLGWLRQCNLTPTDPQFFPGLPYPHDQPLPPGTYEIYISWDMLVANRDIHLDSGPITIEIR